MLSVRYFSLEATQHYTGGISKESEGTSTSFLIILCRFESLEDLLNHERSDQQPC